MQIDLLKNIAASLAGEKAKGIVEMLYGKKNVNEFLIAKKLDVTVNQTRNLLYKLADEGIVSFTKKKDRKKGGWYTYFWTLNQDKSLFKFETTLLASRERLQQQVALKNNVRFFACPNGDVELNEESALQHEYTCPECGEILQVKDNAKEIVLLEKEIAKTNQMLQDVRTELGVVRQKQQVSLARKLKVEERKKKAERAAKKQKAAKEKKALEKKKKSKKPSKK